MGNEAVDQLLKFNASLIKDAPLSSPTSRPRIIDGIVLTKFDTIDDKVGRWFVIALPPLGWCRSIDGTHIGSTDSICRSWPDLFRSSQIECDLCGGFSSRSVVQSKFSSDSVVQNKFSSDSVVESMVNSDSTNETISCNDSMDGGFQCHKEAQFPVYCLLILAYKYLLENNVIIIANAEDISGAKNCLFYFHGIFCCCFCSQKHCVLFFLPLDLFETKKLFSILFVKLRYNVIDGVFKLWNHHMFDCIDPSIGCSDNLIKNKKSCLETEKSV